MDEKFRKIKTASKMKKIKTFKSASGQRQGIKNVMPYYIMAFIVSWTWTNMHDITIALWAHLIMLACFLLICRGVYILYMRVDPVEESINELEQQFWDKQYKKDIDPQL